MRAPGGKIVVYTGILPITDDAGLATVMGHEVSCWQSVHSMSLPIQQIGAVGVA